MRATECCGALVHKWRTASSFTLKTQANELLLLFRFEEQVCPVKTVAPWDRVDTFKPSELFLASTYTQVHTMFPGVCFHPRWDEND